MALSASNAHVTVLPKSELDMVMARKASQALLQHMKSNATMSSASQNMLSTPEDEFANTTVWLVLTTKKHVVDSKRLKPSKILIPHSLFTPEATICLIVADPQRDFKEALDSPAFPEALKKRITRVIGVSKIKERYKPYENKRQLFAEYDVFLADDRIVALLPGLLGKVFYKTGSKRPIPVSITGEAPAQAVVDAKRARAKEDKKLVAKAPPASPAKIAAELNRALSSAFVHLAPSTCTSVRVGLAGWNAKKITENIEAVTNGLVERFVPKKWNGVRGIHLKGPSTAALPLYLSEELWEDKQDILEMKELAIDGPDSQRPLENGGKTLNKGQKRKSKMDEYEEEILDEPLIKRSKTDSGLGDITKEMPDLVPAGKSRAAKTPADSTEASSITKKAKKGSSKPAVENKTPKESSTDDAVQKPKKSAKKSAGVPIPQAGTEDPVKPVKTKKPAKQATAVDAVKVKSTKSKKEAVAGKKEKEVKAKKDV